MKKKFNAKKILGGSNVVSIESGSFTWDISLEVVEVGKNLEKIDEDAS